MSILKSPTTPHKNKRAAPKAAILYLWSITVASILFALLLSVASAANCIAKEFHERVEVDHVYDGDTVRLSDGRKLRFIGINTPELSYEEGRQNEPYARAARDALGELLVGQSQLQLRYDTQRKDHYGRILAHPYLLDGRNITQLLLAKGLGNALVVPPNTWGLNCYQAAERTARHSMRGIWSHAHFQPIKVSQLSKKSRGYRFIQGQILHIAQSKFFIWLNMASNVALRIARKDLVYFPSSYVNYLQGKQVVARGWLHYGRRGFRMSIRHPSALKILE